MLAFQDSPQRNFNISKFCYKVTFYLFIWLIAFTQLSKLMQVNAIVSALLVVLPVLAICVLIPCGLFFLIKSFVMKEPFHRYRILYLIGHLFFLLIMIGMIVAFSSDIARYNIK
ncbi:hypothetical protein SAMN05216524_105119 [Mucilaginibacter sp. OK098]|nr:hypothetical protein SAMN05216524_105119 [Mucilaginibacter sp. OK098]